MPDQNYATPSFPVLRQPTLERVSLLEKLRGALQHRVTLIAAPPGYGKTTLVVQFAQRIPTLVAWHTVEDCERDLPDLLEHSLSALAEIVPSLKTIQLRPEAAPSEAAVLVTAHLRSVCVHDLVYVLDDVHVLLGSARAEAWLRAFIRHMPPLCHVILIGRALPTLPTTEMVARREIFALGQEQLRFSIDEIQHLAEQIGVSVSTREVQRIASRLDGWPAGSLLALQPLPTEVERILFDGEAGPEALFNALAEITLQAQPERLQAFLFSLLDTRPDDTHRMSEGAATAGEPGISDGILDRNLFASQTASGLTYHPLFRNFLQRYFQTHEPQRFAQLHTVAGRWCEENNRLDEAFDHYVSARAYQVAADIAEQTAQVYVAQGKTETVLYWRGQLSDNESKFPELLYTCASIHAKRYQFDQAAGALAEAEAEFRSRQDDLGRLKVNLLQANIDNLRGEHWRATRQTEDLLQRFTVPDNFRGYALYILGTAHLGLGEIQTALEHLEAALPLYRATGDAYALSQLLMALEFADMRLGRFEAASACLHEAIGINRALGNTEGVAALLGNLGYDYHLLGAYEQAFATFQEGLQIAHRIDDKRRDGYLLWSMADLQRDRGAFSEAISLYDTALQHVGSHEPALRCGILVSQAIAQRWQGNLEEGLKRTDEALAIAEKHSLPFEKLKAELSRWAIRLGQDAAREAQSALETLASALEQQQAQTRWAQTLALCAYAALLQGDSLAASQFLKTAVAGVRHETNLQPCIAEIVHLPLLHRFVQENSALYPSLRDGMQRLEAAHLENVVEARNLQAEPIVHTYSLSVWILGGERIERDGEIVPISAWRAADAREMFFYLLLKGAATREQLGLVLWPDSSPEQVKLIFHSTLHRLRKAVGTNAVRFEDERYLIDPHLVIWCDAMEFEVLVQEARLTSPLRVHTENLWRRAVALYEGELLPRIDATWIIAYREALQQMYLEAFVGWGSCVRIRGNFQEAITIFQRALEVDPYREDIHRAILICYAGLGESSSIRRQMERLKQLLDQELGLVPAVETLTLAQSLLA